MDHATALPHKLPPVSGGWCTEYVAVGPRQFRITLPHDPDRMLEDCDDQEATCPYWAALWPTARQMAEFVLSRRWPSGSTAIELGCGVGLVGLSALAAGLDVTFTDAHPLAVAAAAENARHNGFPRAGGWQLDWKNPGAGNYEFVLGSDLLYDRSLHEPLLRTVHANLRPGGTCWLGSPGRSTLPPFVDRARQRGFQVRIMLGGGHWVSETRSNRFQLLCIRPPQ